MDFYFLAETWSEVTEKHLARLEVVDNSLLVRLTGGHSKCASEYNYLETGSFKLRHHLTYLRLLYHHHILTRDKNETISKIYYKQKEENTKCDWFQSLKKKIFNLLNETLLRIQLVKLPKVYIKEQYGH